MKSEDEKYEFLPAEGARISKSDAVVIGTRLTELEEKNGSITPELVVEDAKKLASPLHGFFEWDIHKAAEAHWVERARQLIRSVKITIIKPDGAPIVQRAFVHVISDQDTTLGNIGRGKYVGLVKAMSDDVMRQQVLARALAEVEGWKERYKGYSELGEIFSAIESVKKPKERKAPRRPKKTA